MEQFEIAPHPVKTPEELLAKMNLIQGALEQLLASKDEDPHFFGVIMTRLVGLKDDFDVMDGCTPEQGHAIMCKMDDIAAIVAKSKEPRHSRAHLN